MRTSNKILLGTLLFALLVFAFPVLWVRAKSAAGDYTLQKGEQFDEKNQISLPSGLKAVHIRGIGQVKIIYSDTARMEYWDSDTLVKHYQKDGILYIENDTTKKSMELDPARNNIFILLYLPNVDSIYAVHTQVQLACKADTGRQSPTFNVRLEEAEVTIEQNENKIPVMINELNVHANSHGHVYLYGNTEIRKSTITMTNESDLEDNGRVRIGKLNIQADTTSTAKLRGNNLRSAIITSTE